VDTDVHSPKIRDGQKITSGARVFDITTPGADVTISGLKISGVQSLGNGVSMGGAILNQGGHLTVANDDLSGNAIVVSSPGGSGKGGAIASTGAGASLTVLNSTFLLDSVRGAAGDATHPNGGDGIGGAIFGDVNTTLSVTASTFGFSFASDSATGGNGFGAIGNGGNGQGGAIGFLGTSLSVFKCTFGDPTSGGGQLRAAARARAAAPAAAARAAPSSPWEGTSRSIRARSSGTAPWTGSAARTPSGTA
jgi:hypothetical protein